MPRETMRGSPADVSQGAWQWTWSSLRHCLGVSSLLVLSLSASAQAQDSSSATAVSPTALVDALNGVFGKQTTGRAIHAKGIVLEGTFAASGKARALSTAAHFTVKQVPVIVRFSNFAGIPTIADADPLATPHGIAIKFTLPDGTSTDVVAHSFNGFPTRTAEEFRQLMVALGNTKAGMMPPTPADQFMAGHPTAKSFFDHLPPPPVSFATVEYFGVNSFQFTNAAGRARFGRYQLVPEAGIVYLTKELSGQATPDYLMSEIGDRLASGPIKFLLRVQLAQRGDVIDDPSVAWPDSRPTLDLGVLTLSGILKDSDALQQKLLFTPTAVAPGIATADPMIEARNSAYGVSYARRHSTP